MTARCCLLFAVSLCLANQEPADSTRQPPAPQKNAQPTQQHTARPNEVVCCCKFVELSPAAAAEFYAAADLATPRSSHDSAAPSFAVYNNAEQVILKLRKSGRARLNEGPPIAATIDKPSATLLCGGEFPILIPTGSSNRVTVDWRWFGYRYEVVPHWLDTGRLQLQVTPEIVTKDMKHAVIASGLTIPGLTTRRACARVELNLGETAVVNLGSADQGELESPSPKQSITLFMVTPTEKSGTPASP
jgi:pilus assembly protein CpaC